MSISFLNSLTPRNVVSGFVFTGVYDEVLSTSQISVRITTTSVINSYTLFVEYSNDKVNVVTQESYIAIDNLNYLQYLTPTSRYFRLRLEATSNITNLSIETIFKTAVVYQPETAIYGTVSVNNFPAVDNVVSVNNLPEIQQVSGNVSIISSIPLLITNTEFQAVGKEPQTLFHATPATNIPAVYADATAGINVNGGWLFENTSSNKINWYTYANTVDQASTAKSLKDIKYMYMVIYQNSSALPIMNNPYIAFYSLPEAGTNTSWYKNKYIYSNYDNASEVGNKLLYIGIDNPLIHPEITIRIQLVWDPISSTNTLEAGANETLWLSSIHTSSNTTAGKYNFVFSEFGLNFNEDALNSVVIPIIDNKVQIAGSVAITNTFIHTREEPTTSSFNNNGGSNV